jgi:hypothetical protein
MSDDWLQSTESGTEQHISSMQFDIEEHQHLSQLRPSTSTSAAARGARGGRGSARGSARGARGAVVDDEDHKMNMEYDETIHRPLASSSCCTRRRLILSVAVVAILGAIVGVSVALTSSGKNGDNGKNNNNSSNNNNIDNAFASVPGGAPTMSPAPTPSNANEIGDIINGAARFGGAEFENPTSYQSLAKKWVMTHKYPIQDGSVLSTEQQVLQLYVLACIYYNTYSVRSDWTDFHYGSDVAIPGWFSSLGWMGDPADACNWYGLTCDDQGRVSKIQLDTNGLTGYFPPEVALLHESLNTIDLYNNILHNSGELGNSFLGELTNLELLFFGTTSFEYDGVPTHLGRLTKLRELDFSYTLYFGDLPGEVFANLPDLKYLVMDGNGYNTTLPSELIRLPSLEYLYAGFSFLNGDLNFISEMPRIFELWLDDNPNIGGSIPASIGAATNLASLSITNCGLTGTIPPEIGGLTNMIQMWMYDNQLEGTIPSEMGNLVAMNILNLQKNEVCNDASKSCQ